MNSPFSKLYIDLIDRIKELVPEIQWIDHDLGQLEAFDGDRPPVVFPCLLIDFSTTQFATHQGFQDGNASVGLRLAFDQYQQTHADMPTQVQEQALEYYEIEHKLHQALQGWDDSGFLVNEMIRKSATSEQRQDDNFRVRRMVYEASFIDADPA